MQYISDQLRPFGSWLWRTRLLLLFGGVVIVSLAAGLYIGTEFSLKLTAAFLQALGSVVVVLNNMGTQRRVGFDPMYVRVRRWFRSRPPVLSKVVLADLNIIAGSASLTAHGYVPTVELGVAPAELRLRQIESDISALRKHLADATTDFNEKIGAQRQGLETEKTERLALRQVAESLRDAMADSIDLSTIGTWWLIVGIIVGMFPAEITAWLHPRPPSVWLWFGTEL